MCWRAQPMASGRVLVVGMGPVGQVFARALVGSGCRVGALVKPEHAAGARAGYTMYLLGARKARAPMRWRVSEIFTAPQEVRGLPWDEVLVAVSSTDLRADWLKALAEGCPG